MIAYKKKDLRTIAEIDVKKKDKHASFFSDEMLVFLIFLNNQFFLKFKNENTLINTLNYQKKLEIIFKKNYNNISDDFKKNIRENFIYSVDKETSNVINSSVKDFIKKEAPLRSFLVLDNYNKKIKSKIDQIIDENVKQKKEYSQIEIAEETKKELNNQADGRSKTIGLTETAMIAESAKNIEKLSLNSNFDIRKKGFFVDYWQTMGDANVRPSHSAANGQKKFPDSKFLVGGELLSYPSDANGSAGNIVNCRCSLVSLFEII